MSGVPMHGQWIGAYGAYRVPDAIMWLAQAAQKAAGLEPWNEPPMRRFWLEPLFLVIEEWGKWRESQEPWRPQ